MADRATVFVARPDALIARLCQWVTRDDGVRTLRCGSCHHSDVEAELDFRCPGCNSRVISIIWQDPVELYEIVVFIAQGITGLLVFW